MQTAIMFDTIEAALEAQHGKGGWFFWNQDNGSGTWFPYTITQDEALRQVRGNGFLGMWNQVSAKLNGPIGGPRGEAEPLG